MKEAIKGHFERAVWQARVQTKHRYGGKDSVKQSVSLSNIIRFPIWSFFEFIDEPIGEACFNVLMETVWKMGVMYSLSKMKQMKT